MDKCVDKRWVVWVSWLCTYNRSPAMTTGNIWASGDPAQIMASASRQRLVKFAKSEHVFYTTHSRVWMTFSCGRLTATLARTIVVRPVCGSDTMCATFVAKREVPAVTPLENTLSQAAAAAYIAMQKKCVEKGPFPFPSSGDKLKVPLVSMDGAMQFWLDMTRGRIRLLQVSLLNRVYTSIVLVRLDLDGPPHTNPDGTEIACPHIHLYREGYADKWAEAVPGTAFTNLTDPWTALHDFMRYCNVTQLPAVHKGLFP